MQINKMNEQKKFIYILIKIYKKKLVKSRLRYCYHKPKQTLELQTMLALSGFWTLIKTQLIWRGLRYISRD